MTTVSQKNTVSADGLRYKTRKSGAEFTTPATGTALTMSCLKCGKYRLRSMMKNFKLAGANHPVCSPSCKELSEKLDAAT